MEYKIWDAVIHNYNTPKAEDIVHFVGADSDKGKKLVEGILFFILDSYGERGIKLGAEPDKEKELAKTVSLLHQCASNLSAMDIMKIVCPILLAFPSFIPHTASSLISAGMMLANNDIIDNNPLENGIIYEILFSNLFGVLSLEAIGQKIEPDSFLNLNQLKAKCVPENEKFLEQDIQPILLPEELRKLFVIERKSEKLNSPYQIGTQFPELLYAILKNIRTSPLSENPKTSNSIQSLKEFYDNCIRAISPNGVWSERGFAVFYLYERIFRLNAKFSLACLEYDLKGEFVLSPELLRDFFFHSPLVIFPQNIITLFYSGSREQGYSVQLLAKQFLHLLIQLSAYWFPFALSIIRAYMWDCKIQSFEDICKFFFPESNSFLNFQKKYNQSLEKLPSYKKFFPEEGIAERRARESFSKRWSIFRPHPSYCTEAYAPWLIDDWRSMLYHDYQYLSDSEAAKDILLTLMNLV